MAPTTPPRYGVNAVVATMEQVNATGVLCYSNRSITCSNCSY